MKIRFFICSLLFCIAAGTNSFSQIQKDSWHFGFSGAPLFELNSNGLSGGLFNLHAEYAFSNRFIAGVQPYYAVTDENNTYAYDLTLNEPRSIRKDVYNSLGMNAELKFIIHNGPGLIPYSTVIFGAGYSSYQFYQNNVFGDLVPEDLGHFINYNLGIGVGTYIKVTDRCYIDTKIMYTEVGASKDIKPSNYLYPSVGLMKRF